LMLRGYGPDSLTRRRQGQDRLHGAGKGARFTATEAGFDCIQQAVRIG